MHWRYSTRRLGGVRLRAPSSGPTARVRLNAPSIGARPAWLAKKRRGTTQRTARDAAAQSRRAGAPDTIRRAGDRVGRTGPDPDVVVVDACGAGLYDLTVAKAQNQSLVDKRDSLKRTYESGDSAPELSDKAARLGLVPAGTLRDWSSANGPRKRAGQGRRRRRAVRLARSIRSRSTTRCATSTPARSTTRRDCRVPARMRRRRKLRRTAANPPTGPPASWCSLRGAGCAQRPPPTPTSDGGAPGPNPRRTAQ